MRYYYCVIILGGMIFMMNCDHQVHSDHSKIVKRWQGKTINLPTRINWKVMGKDTICPELLNSPYKILVYIDSIGCTPCKFQTSKWQILIDTCQQSQLNNSFLFVIHSTNYNELNIDFLIQNFSYPVIYDSKNDFYKLNHFPKEPYQIFLLDKDNKVILIGSPINNPKMWKLYKKIISQ